LISGIKVEIEGKVIDSSMKNRIKNLRSELLKEGR
jgi:F0F1-type ATP synthase delta subunit